jgi:hypothetical protein
MSQFSRCIVVVVVLLASGACSSSKGGGAGGGGGTGGAGGSRGGSGGAGGVAGSGGVDAGTGGAGGGGVVKMDASPATMVPRDCLGLRECVYACARDTACAARCVSGAPRAAQDLYNMIRTCSLANCPLMPDGTQDVACRCENECYGGGPCSDMVTQCLGDKTDTFCDPFGADCML